MRSRLLFESHPRRATLTLEAELIAKASQLIGPIDRSAPLCETLRASIERKRARRLHLLTSVALTPRATLWTRDRRLQSAAVALLRC